MTAELGLTLRGLIAQDGRSRAAIARQVGKDSTFLGRAAAGSRNFGPETAISFARAIKLPQYALPGFYLLAIGCPRPFIDKSIIGIRDLGLPPERATFHELFLASFNECAKPQLAIATAVGVDPADINRLVNGGREGVRTETAVALAREIYVPRERLAEFVLLGRGFPSDTVYKSLHALDRYITRARPTVRAQTINAR